MTKKTNLFTEVILLIFRVNGQLLTAGNRLVQDLNLTSARWQMLGAIALSETARSAPQLAAKMGVTRQAAQKQLNVLLEEGLVEAQPNPGNVRSPHYRLTRTGRAVYGATERLQSAWAGRLARDLRGRDLESTKRILEALSEKLNDS